MSQEDNVINVDANVVCTMYVESQNITSVADIPGVAMHKPKKSKRVSQRGVTKRGSLGDDDNFTPTKPHWQRRFGQHCGTNVHTTRHPRRVTSVPLDELFDCDDNSVQSIEDNTCAYGTIYIENQQLGNQQNQKKSGTWTIFYRVICILIYLQRNETLERNDGQLTALVEPEDHSSTA